MPTENMQGILPGKIFLKIKMEILKNYVHMNRKKRTTMTLQMQ